MTDLPIPFMADMIRALLDARKTQTRRVGWRLRRFGKVSEFGRSDTKGCDWHFRDKDGRWHDLHHADLLAALPHRVGDRLYVREAWRVSNKWDHTAPRDLPPRTMTVMFEAGGSIANQRNGRWESDFAYPPSTPRWAGRPRASMHMPRWASRLTLTVTDVRVERLQEVSEADAIAEGAWSNGKGYVCFETTTGRTEMLPNARLAFAELWNSLNAVRGYGWDANPWVTATTFTVRVGNIDEVGHGR